MGRRFTCTCVVLAITYASACHAGSDISSGRSDLAGREYIRERAARAPHVLEEGLRSLLSSDSTAGQTFSDRHKSWAWSWRNLLGIVLACTVGSLGNAVGIGGGAFFVPLGEVLLQFSLKGATALSQAIITGGAVASVAMAVTARHPVDPSRPLIDYGTALMLTPVLLLGVSVGVLLNGLFPDWLLTILLTVLLLWLTLRSGLKAWRLFKSENAARSSAVADTELQPRESNGPGAKGVGEGQAMGSAEDTSGSGRRGSRNNLHDKPRGPRRRNSTRGAANASPVKDKTQSAASSPFRAPLSIDDKQQIPTKDGVKSSPKLDAAGLKQQAHRSQPLSLRDDMALETPPVFGMSDRSDRAVRALLPVLPPKEGTPRPQTKQLDRNQSLPSDPSLDGAAGTSTGNGIPRHGSGTMARHGSGTIARHGSGTIARHGSGAIAISVMEPPRPAMPGGQDSVSSVHASQSGSGPNDRSVEAINGQTPPWLQMIEVVVLWACFLGLQLGKGRFKRCSALYFVLFGFQALLSVAANVLFTRQARKAAEALQHGSTQPILTAPDGVAFIEPATWGLPALIRCSLVALAGGSVAGLLGIGGGMVIAPLLLELGLHPVVAAATSTLMVLFSASTAALAFGFEGILNVTYALIFGIGATACPTRQ